MKPFFTAETLRKIAECIPRDADAAMKHQMEVDLNEATRMMATWLSRYAKEEKK